MHARLRQILTVFGMVRRCSLTGEEEWGFVPNIRPTPVTVAASYTTGADDYKVNGNAAAGAITITPDTTAAGRILVIQKTDSSANAVTIGATVDGSVNPTLSTQYQLKRMIFNGSAWETC